MTIQTRELYHSSNGDRWYLARDSESGRVFIKHQPNAPSGGKPTDIEIETFLCRSGASSPERSELLRLVGTLVREVEGAVAETGMLRKDWQHDRL